MALAAVALLIFATAAITSSPKPLRTILNIVLSGVIGLGIGAGVGYVFGNSGAGADLAAALMIILGLTTAMRETYSNRRKKRNSVSES